MAWNGTVTCSWCYRQGHNRRSCESLKDRYQEALAKSEEERGHSDNSIIREVTYSKTYHRERKCTYCKTVGHNRRGCEMLKAHKDYVFRQDVAFKKAFLQECNEIGLGVGAFIRHDYNGTLEARLEYVARIDWSRINVWAAARAGVPRVFIAKPVRKMGQDGFQDAYTIKIPSDWPLGEAFESDRWLEESYSLEVVSKAPGPLRPPEGSVENHYGLDEFFSERQSWEWNYTGEDGSKLDSCDFWKLEEEQELKETA